MQASVIIITAYLLGCISTGYYLVLAITGQDIRKHASGNSGSRNAGRLLGRRGFLLTLLGDSGKGLLAVYLASRLDGSQLLATASLAAVTAGHIWPLQLRFRGGKGFATFAGGMLLLNPQLLLAGALLCIILYPIIGGSTRCGLLALAVTPLLLAAHCLHSGKSLLTGEFALFCLLVATILFAHRSNIRKELIYSATPEG